MKVALGPSDVAICVLSCDPYSDLWQPFFTLFWRYWPDCPFPVYLTSNTREYADPRVKTILVGAELRDWSGSLARTLQQVESRYVLLTLEDFFFQYPVPVELLNDAVSGFVRLNGRMLRLTPRPGPDQPVAGQTLFGGVLPGSPYRVSAQAALWRRDELQWLLREGESIWEFELAGSKRSAQHPEGYFAATSPLLPYRHHGVERGKWFPWAARRFGAMNIGCDFQRRPVMSAGETIRWTIRKAASYRSGLVRLLKG